MKRPVIVLVLLLAVAASVYAQDKPTTTELKTDSSNATVPPELLARDREQQLTEKIAELQLQNAQLRAQLADTTAKLNSYELTALGQDLKAKRDALDLEMKKALGGTAEDELDKSVTPPRLVKKQKVEPQKEKK